MAHVIILGAGLTGLSTAYHLEALGFVDYELFEKEATVGGLCRSVHIDGYTFDYTGHLLHINNEYIRTLINRITNQNHWNTIQRRSAIYTHDTFVHYPIQTNLYGLPTHVIAACIESFVTRKHISHPRSFYQWVCTHFGTQLGELFFFPYQEKLLCQNVSSITHSWTGRFVPRTSLTDMINGALTPNTHIGYNASFSYPKTGGINTLVRALYNHLIQPVHTCHEAKSIDIKNRTITFHNGVHKKYDILINTIPLDTLLERIVDTNTTHLHHAHRHLKKASVLNINLGINTPHVSDYHWIYTPEKSYPFYRIGFPHHFTHTNTPPAHCSAYTECAYIGTPPHTITRDVIRKTCDLFNIKTSDITTQVVLNLTHAYVIYDHWREKNLSSLLARLQKNSIYSIGRYGAWKYASMQEALLDGMSIVETLTAHSHIYRTKREKSYTTTHHK
jgi:protoporphyrinogen oxidase